MPRVNPEILVWARETAGLPLDEAVKKLVIRDTKKATALDRLAGYESGDEEPSRPLLQKMAKQYHRPLLTFYLSQPPVKGDRGADFRTLPTEAHSPATDATLDALIRDIRARQSMVRAILEDEEESPSLPFVGSRTMADGQAAALTSLGTLLRVRLEEYRSQPNSEAAFNLLRARAEREGIFVMLKGDLGSYHSAIEPEVFRGFSIADDIAPFIAINDRDARATWPFTLLHETVHLLLGQTGVSGQQSENETERFCDDVASEFLLPRQDSASLDLKGLKEIDEIAERLSAFAAKRNISRTMVAYRALRDGSVKPSQYKELSDRFREEWLRQRASQRAQRQPQEGGPDYYVVRRHRLGPRLVSLVRRMTAGRELSTTKAARILGVRPAQVQAILAGSGPS